MNDLISRQAAIDKMAELQGRASTKAEFKGISKAWKLIKKLPSAQPERKRGRWLPDNRPGGGFWVCSECKFPSEAFAADVLYKFCPNCGAEMREGE